MNALIAFDSLYLSVVVSSLVCPAGAGECAMISFLSCLFSSSGLHFLLGIPGCRCFLQIF